MEPVNRNAFLAATIFEELRRSGIRHVVVSPGSRSTPLALAVARTTGLRHFVHLDERSAAFFALGIAKATRAPVALVCTSGTAVANWLPAVVEASLARVPLLLLSADRPAQLRDCSAPQTIDQLRVFGGFVRHFAESSVPGPNASGMRALRATACRVVGRTLAAPPGPVHWNLLFDEPLASEPVPADVAAHEALPAELRTGRALHRPWLEMRPVATRPDPEIIDALAERLASSREAAILAGPLDATPALACALTRLARTLGAPLLADGASSLRGGTQAGDATLVTVHDALLRVPCFASSQRPRTLLRFGPPLTSRSASIWWESAHHAERVLVDADGLYGDPSHVADRLIHADPTAFAQALADAVAKRGSSPRESDLARAFRRAEAAARAALADVLDAAPTPFGPHAVRALAEALPDDAILFASNSMAVRDVDGFLPASAKRLRVLANRGANGIDGIPSTALGAAIASERPLVLLTGDLAFLHDASGLASTSRHAIDATIVVVNDDGGSIFSYLPIARHASASELESLFTTPHGLDLAAATALLRGRHQRASSHAELAATLKDAIARPGVDVIELPVAHDASVALHRAAWDAVRVALEGIPW